MHLLTKSFRLSKLIVIQYQRDLNSFLDLIEPFICTQACKSSCHMP